MESQFYISREGQESGPFSEQEVRDGLRVKQFNGTDFYWKEGMAEWQPLNTIMRPPPPPSKTTVKQEAESANLSTAPTFWRALNWKELFGGLVVICIIIFWEHRDRGVKQNHEESASTVAKSTSRATAAPPTSGDDTSTVNPSVPPPKLILEGNRALSEMGKIRDIEGTSVKRDDALNDVERKYLGKRLEFEGIVDDVESDAKIKVKIDSGNYANVFFETPSPMIHDLKKGVYIKFNAILLEFGTGIMFKHDLTEARM